MDRAAVSVARILPSTGEENDEEPSEFVENEVENLVENVNVSDLEGSDEDESTSEIDEEMEAETQTPAVAVPEDRTTGMLNCCVSGNFLLFSKPRGLCLESTRQYY